MENCEVIVVDNCSTDGSLEMVELTFPQVKLIKPGENIGFARANNQGARSAYGRYLLFLNPDTVVFPDTFRSMIEFMDSQPNAGAANCLVLNEDGTIQLLATRRKPTLLVLILESLGLNRRFPNNYPYRKYVMADWDRSAPRSVEVISGAFFMIRSDLFQALKGFDERYFMYVEDFDLSNRIIAHGQEILFNPSTKIVHYGGKSSSSFKSFSTMKGIAAFYSYLSFQYSIFCAKLYQAMMLSSFLLLYAYDLMLLLLRDDNDYYTGYKSCSYIIAGIFKLGR
jgi:GT2 family glycosyltransferase